MPFHGYARVSTLDQDLSIQRAALKAAGCEVIRAEKASGARRDGRTELQVRLDFLRAGDTLVVTRIDRLARSLKDLQDIVHELKAKGVALRATEQPVNTGTAAGKAFLDMLGVFAEFETNLRRERQLEGINAAKVRGVYKGRKPSIDASCAGRKSLDPRRSRGGLASAERRQCRSGVRCVRFIRSSGHKSVSVCGSSAPGASVRGAVARMAKPFAVCRTGVGLMPRVTPGAMAAAGLPGGPTLWKRCKCGKPA